MTREEAIELLDILPLCNECDSSNFPYTCVECGDAFLLAMEALKQPEVVLCKDCKHGSIYMTEDVCGKTLIECNHPELGDYIAIHAWDWFCADGRKRDG